MKINFNIIVVVFIGLFAGAVVFLLASPVFILIAAESDMIFKIRMLLVALFALSSFAAGFAALTTARSYEKIVKWIMLLLCALAPWFMLRYMGRKAELELDQFSNIDWLMIVLQSLASAGGCKLGILKAEHNRNKKK